LKIVRVGTTENENIAQNNSSVFLMPWLSG